jgi:hypothetical protein
MEVLNKAVTTSLGETLENEDNHPFYAIWTSPFDNVAMSSSGESTTFAEATAVKASSSHEYEAYFPDDWCIGSGML